MSANPVGSGRLVPGLVEQLGIEKPNKVEMESGGVQFTELLADMLSSVNQLQSESSAAQTALMNGEPVELHQVMIKAEEAGLAMDLLLEIRNKLVTAYNDLTRMPI
jgi:flagellar hook-basal body complex protein FliE